MRDSTTHRTRRRTVLSASAGSLAVLAGAGAVDAERSQRESSRIDRTETTESMSVSTRTEPPAVERSRSQTVVGAPVSFRSGDRSPVDEWTLERAPGWSRATVRESTGSITSVRPDVPGRYVVSATTGGETDRVSFTATPRSKLIERFAPRLHFHEDTAYRPTRLEALVENARLRSNDETVVASPTLFDLAGRDESHYLELEGARFDYPAYQEAFRPTIYANVTETTYREERYTAVVYWFIYTYDPKHGFARFGAHQADVESLVVLVDRNGEGAFVAPAAHGGMTVRPFEQAVPEGTHVDVYPEHKSHATYLRDSSAYDGDGFQVYAFWSDADADCDELEGFQSAFHSEWTGSETSWSHDESVGVTYELVELTGNEVWADYEGGLAAEPGSITPPHQRQHYGDPGGRMHDRGCPDRAQVSGRITFEGTSSAEEGATTTVELAVTNDGGKPHPFWIDLETDDGESLARERVRVGTANPGLLSDGRDRAVSLEFTSPGRERELQARLWLHGPDVRRDRDLKDSTEPFALTDEDNRRRNWF